MKRLSHKCISPVLMAMLCLGFHVLADAKVKLPALVSDGMVLQREQSVMVWGTA